MSSLNVAKGISKLFGYLELEELCIGINCFKIDLMLKIPTKMLDCMSEFIINLNSSIEQAFHI